MKKVTSLKASLLDVFLVNVKNVMEEKDNSMARFKALIFLHYT